MRHDGGVELIAHRAGNEPHLVAPALAVAALDIAPGHPPTTKLAGRIDQVLADIRARGEKV